MGAPQRGHRALLEPLKKFGDALCIVGAIAPMAADRVPVEAVTESRSWEGEW